MPVKTREQIRQEIMAVEAEIARRKLPNRVLASTFGPQKSFVLDASRLKAAICGRRAGKTYGVASWLVLGALASPESLSLYIHLTRMEAKRTIWQTFRSLDKAFNIGGTFREADLEYHLPNGSYIQVTGCPDSTHIDTYRGKGYKRVAIDEAASFPSYLTRLIEEVLLPALADHQGELVLIGTPAVSPVGYLYDVAVGHVQGWSSSHHWTMVDNPHLPHAQDEIRDMLARRGWTREHPTFRREWLGLWVADLGMLVYHAFSPEKSLVDALPDDLGPWQYVLGIDLGASEAKPTTAYALLAYSDRCRTAFVIETKGEAGATPSSIADQIRRYDATYQLEAIVADAGALGAGYVRELRERHRLPVEPADKVNKRGYIELLNGDLAINLKLLRSGTSALQAEMAVLPWSDDTKTTEKRGVPNHHCDATLYAWRRCRQYQSVPDGPPPPKPGTDAWREEEERRFDEFQDRQFRERKTRAWWHRRPGHQ